MSCQSNGCIMRCQNSHKQDMGEDGKVGNCYYIWLTVAQKDDPNNPHVCLGDTRVLIFFYNKSPMNICIDSSHCHYIGNGNRWKGLTLCTYVMCGSFHISYVNTRWEQTSLLNFTFILVWSVWDKCGKLKN